MRSLTDITEERATAVVVDRLGQVRSLEAEIEAGLSAQRSALRANPQAVAAMERLLALVRRHQTAIDGLLGSPGPRVPEAPAVVSAPSVTSPLESVARSAIGAVIAYSSLYTVARLMYRPDSATWRRPTPRPGSRPSTG